MEPTRLKSSASDLEMMDHPNNTYADRFRKKINDRPFADLKPVSPDKIAGFMFGLGKGRICEGNLLLIDCFYD